jgi:hypothetical protein
MIFLVAGRYQTNLTAGISGNLSQNNTIQLRVRVGGTPEREHARRQLIGIENALSGTTVYLHDEFYVITHHVIATWLADAVIAGGVQIKEPVTLVGKSDGYIVRVGLLATLVEFRYEFVLAFVFTEK